MSDSAQQCSRRLRERRIRAGLTQRQLAKLADVASNTVSMVERGRHPLPAVQVKLARALGVDVFDIWPLDGDVVEIVDAEVVVDDDDGVAA